jgi:ribosomal protein L11 methyltransferase
MAFGTGTHATTSGCLKMLATLDRAETANAVDVGCGSGILAIAMAKLWQRPVIGGDNDAEAVEVAQENAVLNGVSDLCRFVHAIGLRNDELQARLPYDLVVANILAGPLMELAESFSAAVRPGGRALLSGLLLEFWPRTSHRPRDRRRDLAHLAAAARLGRALDSSGPRASRAPHDHERARRARSARA